MLLKMLLAQVTRNLNPHYVDFKTIQRNAILRGEFLENSRLGFYFSF